MNARLRGRPQDLSPFQVTAFQRGTHQWVKVVCAIGLYDFQVWRGRLAYGDLWSILHRLETGVPFASPYRFVAKVPEPFSPVHPNVGPDRRFLTIHRDGIEALVLYCVSSSIPHALHVALVNAWSYDPDAAGGIDEGHRQELRRDPEGSTGAEPGQSRLHGEGPGADLDQAARQPRRGHGREVGRCTGLKYNRFTVGTIPAEYREEILAEMEKPHVARIRPKELRIYQATLNVKKRHGDASFIGRPRRSGFRVAAK